MKIINSTLANQIRDIHITDSGNFYFLDGIVISEINENVTYTWEEAQHVVDAIKQFYGPSNTIYYISNRVNTYSVKPSDWLNFLNGSQLNGYAVVTRSENSWFNALMEKLFLKIEISRFDNLYHAIECAKNVNKTNSNLAC
ncbi:hypothetical protein [Psychroserpens sp. NJDZ02]|uniref:hypothetical protein n=1 Tax=Psychroserpens sp. NJDZ02 TaxID=2570561 RepID=UPI0010A835F8|nr:hypothetical protein [Psychroserpens sp. NJDZ02]QCE42674.1 hypothetical protein E9099_15085 [Psychroserpens sp. NJDZ02]